jgi:SAM-dependent methyltransferase
MARDLATLDRETRKRLLARSVRRSGRAQEEFIGREAELAAYLDRSAGRFARTLPLVDAAIARGGRGAALEVGADPWLFTQLLAERGLQPTSAGQRRGAWREDLEEPTPQRIRISWSDRELELDHHLFDAERERWPFADGSFALVSCMEVLEHLVFSPAHLLYEARRVLEPGGMLLLTTPNAAAAAKLALLARGRNVYGPYSGYGAHGRHNREWTLPELRSALDAAGFDVEATAANIDGYEPPDRLGRALRRLLPRRGDHLFALARAVRPPRLAFLPELYRSFDRERLRAEGVVLVDEVADPLPGAQAQEGEAGVVETTRER